eukprot:8456293-Lingulodinium_polyedra.AAC.1
MQSAKLVLHAVQAKPGLPPGQDVIVVNLPGMWGNVCVLVRLRSEPLMNDMVSRAVIFRSHPKRLRGVLGSDAENVLNICKFVAERSRNVFDQERRKQNSKLATPARKTNQVADKYAHDR